VQVAVDGALDALETLPIDVAFMRSWDQREPLITGLAPIALALNAGLESSAALGLPVRIGATISRVRQQLVDRAIDRTLPANLRAWGNARQLQGVFVKSQQGLANRPDALELVKDQADGFPDASVRILLQPMLFGLAESNWCDDDQLAALGHRAPSL